MTHNLAFLFSYTNALANGVIILITLLNIIVYKLQKLQEAKFGEQINLSSSSLQQLCRCFSLIEIQRATNNFSDELVIGQGGFGKVYKGIIDSGASVVAMKRLSSKSNQGSAEFRTEIEMLSKFRHSHLVSLIGYCDGLYEMILVYEYMPYGTLADNLHKRKKVRNGDFRPLSWVQRLKICIGSARGLEYLHTGTGIQNRVIHRDVKSTNILLDENLAAKISDFGLSKIGPANQESTYVSTHIKGTIGYLDPHYFSTRRLTKKSDVYSFGVVLFEVLCGRPAVDSSLDEEQISLAGWAQHCSKEGVLDQLIDPSVKDEIVHSSLDAFVQVAMQCLHNGPKNRPTMAQVVVGLESALALQEGIPYTLAEWPTTNGYQVHVDSQLVVEGIQENLDSLIVEVENANHKQENSKSSMETAKRVINSGHHDEQSPAGMTFTKKVAIFLSVVTARVFSVHSDAKPSRKLKKFTLAELRKATRNFGPGMLLGDRSLERVFKGWVHEKTYAPSEFGVGMAVAVKRIMRMKRKKNFGDLLSAEPLLGGYNHPNLVKLLGYCMEDNECLLVFEYMHEGSLDTHLFERKKLSWLIRLKISIGAARCLAYLHTTENHVTYVDFKTSHILLDGEFNAKLSRCHMARLGPAHETEVTRRIMGTYGYMAHEYDYYGQLSMKIDAYAFGVVLLELLVGHKRIDQVGDADKVNLVLWARPLLYNGAAVETELLDPWLKDSCPEGAIGLMSSLILECLDDNPKNRPSMVQVVKTLELIASVSVKSSDIMF